MMKIVKKEVTHTRACIHTIVCGEPNTVLQGTVERKRERKKEKKMVCRCVYVIVCVCVCMNEFQ